ncbi:MAG: hypothetical protein GXO91_07420 [FCB group bacterium]|nr:hypothetical protein [FCB group bacterium]
MTQKNYLLRFITEPKTSRERAEELAESLQKTLCIKADYKISSYYKFKSSFEIEFFYGIKRTGDFVVESVELTDRVCSPWLIRYDREDGEVELIFNKNKFSKFRKTEFEAILWAIFERC